MTLAITVIVCAHNEERSLPACLHSILAQTRPPDELLVINNASTDETGAVARQIPHVRVVDEPRKGLVVARETGRLEARGNLLVYIDADCRAPVTWLERIERHFARDACLVEDLLARIGRVATLGRRNFGLREDSFAAYHDDIRAEAARAERLYGMLVVPGAEVTQNSLRGKQNSHIIALDIKRYISADQPALDVLREIRRQDALSTCHPHHRTTRRIEVSTCYLWDHRKELSNLVDVWEAANRDDLFSVTSLKHYPYVANSDFHKPKHLHSWKTLLRCEKTWPAIKRALRSNVDIALTLFRNGAWNPS